MFKRVAESAVVRGDGGLSFLEDGGVCVCVLCELVSTAFSPLCRGASVAHRSDPADTPLSLGIRRQAPPLPFTPQYVTKGIKCRKPGSGAEISGPAACFLGIRRRKVRGDARLDRAIYSDLKSPSIKTNGAPNAPGELPVPNFLKAELPGRVPEISRPAPGRSLTANAAAPYLI